MKFTHLHVHSHYSLLDGLGKIDELIAETKELGMDSIALTDHGVMYGAVDLFITAKNAGVKPIIGCEMYVAPNGLGSKNPTAGDRKRNHLILLAKNETGYKNLMRLVSLANVDGFYYKPRIDRKVLAEHAEGLIATSACAEGEVPDLLISGKYNDAVKMAKEYESIMGKGNFFLEIQHHPNFDKQNIANEGLKKISHSTGIPLVAASDVHYIKKDDSEVQDILLCIQTNRKVQETDRMNLTDFDLSLRSPEEMIKNHADTPDAIDNTQKIADMINFEMRLGETQLPHFEVPDGHDDKSFLRKMTADGMRKKIGENPPQEYIDRVEYELGIIEKTGYPSYFLIVQDFTNWAKDNGIVVGPGRGSAAGSLVSYLIGITNLDPIKYKLLFERFLNPERVSMPDVDIDFADDRRDDVLEYCREKYGRDHVAQIITFGTMAARAAIRDVGRALGYPYDFCDKTAKMIPMFTSIEGALEDAADLKKAYDSDPAVKKLIDAAKRLEGVCRHSSVHACGTVITKDPVPEYTPLQKITRGDVEAVVTQYSSSTKTSFVEKIGLLKMDFLGLKNLTIIQNTLKIVKKTKGDNIDINKISLDDEKAYKLLQEGQTTGVFQLESSGMKRYLKQLKPTVLEDVIAMVALYRPGPMDWIPDFINGKHGRKEVKYLHPNLEPILKDTYGVAVYQEQVMQIAQAIAGFTLGEADILRKAMGKKIIDLIQEQKIKFIEGAVKEGTTKEIAQRIFAFIEPFAGYGFNRSHAACYGLIGYQTAYLKAHYPAEFMAALLTADQDNSDRVAIEVAECRDMGIEVLPPNINESFEEFAVITDENGKERIRFGLNAIKNVGHTIAHEIVKERKNNGKFKSIADLVERVKSKDLNKKSIEALAKVGALDEIGERNQIISSIESIINYIKEVHHNSNTNQGSLFGDTQISTPQIVTAEAEPATKKEKLLWEKELLGLYVSDHPTTEYKEYFNAMGIPTNKFEKRLVNQNITVGGVISKVQKIYTKRKQEMVFVTLEDMYGAVEALVFPNTLEKTESIWAEEKIVMMDGKLSDKDGVYKLIAESAREISLADIEDFRRIAATRKAMGDAASSMTDDKNVLIMLEGISDPHKLSEISKLLDTCPRGTSRVFIQINGHKIETENIIDNNDDFAKQLKEISTNAEITKF